MAKISGKVIVISRGNGPHDTDPTMDRELMAAIDETIAGTSNCCRCGGSVHLVTTPQAQSYRAWLVCDNPLCAREQTLEQIL